MQVTSWSKPANQAIGWNVVVIVVGSILALFSWAGADISDISNNVMTLCCTDQQPGAVSPPQRHLREANVLRPAKLEHAVQRGGSNGHLGRLPASGP